MPISSKIRERYFGLLFSPFRAAKWPEKPWQQVWRSVLLHVDAESVQEKETDPDGECDAVPLREPEGDGLPLGDALRVPDADSVAEAGGRATPAGKTNGGAGETPVGNVSVDRRRALLGHWALMVVGLSAEPLVAEKWESLGGSASWSDVSGAQWQPEKRLEAVGRFPFFFGCFPVE